MISQIGAVGGNDVSMVSKFLDSRTFESNVALCISLGTVVPVDETDESIRLLLLCFIHHKIDVH